MQVMTALNEGSSISFSEYFRKAENTITQLDNSIVRMSLLQPQTEFVHQAIDYVKQSQEVVRKSSVAVRAMLEYSNAESLMKRAEVDSSSGNPYIRQAASKRRLEAVERLIEILGEQKGLKSDLNTALDELKASVEKLGAEPGVLVDLSLVEASVKK